MLLFWIGALLLTALAAAPIVHLAARPLRIAADPARGVYRRQLAEIDDLAARGVLADAEVQSAHAEAARRLLKAGEAPAEQSPTRVSRLAVLVTVAAVGLAAPALYFLTGSPGLPDAPFAKRLADWRAAPPATLEPQEMAAVLSGVVAERPGQIEPLIYLARAQMAAGDGPASSRTLLRALKIDPRRADLWSMLGQLRVAEAEDKVTPEAVEAFTRAAAIDPQGTAHRYYLARAKVEAGQVAQGVAEWRALAADLPPEERAALEADIAAAGRPSPLVTPNDPAIRAMVAGLAARLAEAPNDAAGWERLVRSYRVLGDEVNLQKALAQARVQFKGRADILATIEAAGAR